MTGAGDTVVATFAMAAAAGANRKTSTLIANHAAGLVIRELGTASTTVLAIRESLSQNGSWPAGS